MMSPKDLLDEDKVNEVNERFEPASAEDIEKAAKTDCRQAYASMGLLAAVPLAFDALRDKGCRW